jgi:hypothetical protein
VGDASVVGNENSVTFSDVDLPSWDLKIVTFRKKPLGSCDMSHQIKTYQNMTAPEY